MPSIKNISEVFNKIIEGATPERFNIEHLRGIGFSSSYDRAIIPILKDLGFIDNDGRPTQRYKEFRDRSRSKIVMAEALREAYSDIFLIRENGISKSDREAIEGKFKSVHGSTDRVAELQAMTFLSLLPLADFSAVRSKEAALSDSKVDDSSPDQFVGKSALPPMSDLGGRGKRDIALSYRVDIYLPATRDIETYNAIFRSIKENLLNE